MNGAEFNHFRAENFNCFGIWVLAKDFNKCARLMNITESTASTYRTRLMEKLGLTSTAELIRFALENGIIG